MPVSDTSIEMQDTDLRVLRTRGSLFQTSSRSAITKGYTDSLNNILSRYGQCLIKKNVPVYHLDN